MENVQNTALAELLPEIEAVSRAVSAKWSYTVDSEDLTQEAVVILLRDRYAVRLLEMEYPARKYVLTKIAGRIAAQAATDYEYYSGNFTYSTDEVRSLLTRGALDAPGHEVLDGDYDDTNGGDPVAVAAVEISTEGLDVRTCFARLPERQQGLLIDRYVHGVTSPDATVRKALSRAVEVLTYEMNNAHRRAQQEYEAR